MPDTAGPVSPVALIAGRGDLPRNIAEHRAALNLPTHLVVFPDCYQPWMADHSHGFYEFERIARVFRDLRAMGTTHVVFAGGMNRPRIRPWRVDLGSLCIAVRAWPLLRKGDNAMLSRYAAMIEERGFTVIGAQEILGDELTIDAGSLGQLQPDHKDMEDAARAAAIVNALSPLDVGQGAVVAGGLCLAVEAIEGTNGEKNRTCGTWDSTWLE